VGTIRIAVPTLSVGLALAASAAVAPLNRAVAQPLGKASCDRFAAPRGSDSNPGTVREPFETVERLARSLRPGETGCLGSGLYGSDLHLRQGGVQGKRLTLRPAPGAKATVCGFVVFMPGAGYWRLTGLRIDGSCSSQNTIQIYADHATLDHDDVTNRHLGPSCVLLGYRTEGNPRAIRIQHNRVHACGRRGSHWEHGIYASSPRSARITDNYVYDNAGFGIHLYADAQSTLVERNVVVASGTESGLVFGGAATSASSGNLVRHNIFSGNAKYGASSSWDGPIGDANVLAANCFWGNRDGPFPSTRVGFRPGRNVEANPRFIAPAAGDFRLRSGSRCSGMEPRGHVGP
jgi:parallel beta-helix repeat protein